MHESVPAIAAAGASPLVRIPDMQAWMAKRRQLITRASYSQAKHLLFDTDKSLQALWIAEPMESVQSSWQ